MNNSQAYDNAQTGFDLSSPGSVVLQNDVAHNNQTGIAVYNSSGMTIIGSPSLSLTQENLIYGNTSDGINASGKVQVVGNSVYNNSASSSTVGIYLSGSAQASQNVVHDNSIGIESSNGGTVSSNRVYHNAKQGIYIFSGSTSVLGNTVYSNSIGIQGGTGSPYGYYGQIANNLVYANSNEGIELQYAYNGAQVTNNTVYQPVGDAVLVQGGSQNVTLRNNILWVLAGYDLNVDPSSQIGFNSDYNDMYASAPGQIAFWQGVPRPTLFAWQNTAFDDQNGLSRDPLFVNPLGADGILGYYNATNDGRDDNFHLQSPVGYFTGSLAPVADTITGEPTLLAQTELVNAALGTSPAIDRGDPTSSFSNEPAPNGGFINLGADGNTSFASISASQYVLVTRPVGGEVWPELQTFQISWRSQDVSDPNNTLDTIDIDLTEQNNPSFDLPIATGLPATSNGQYSWTIPTSITPAADYVIKVTRVAGGGNLFGASLAPFTITSPQFTYYVADPNKLTHDSHDWTSALVMTPTAASIPRIPRPRLPQC